MPAKSLGPVLGAPAWQDAAGIDVRPVRTAAEVFAAVMSGGSSGVTTAESDAAFAWWAFLDACGVARDARMRFELRHPLRLPELGGASELARCTWALLSDVAEGRVVMGDPYAALADRLGWRQSSGAPCELSAWSHLERALTELRARGVIRPAEGGLLLMRVPT